MSRYEPVASGVVRVGDFSPAPPRDVPRRTEAVDHPYASGALPHGPAFQYLVHWRLGEGGALGVLDAGHAGVPRGQLHQGLLDGITHAIPHDMLDGWSPRIAHQRVGYPHRIAWCRFHEPLPSAGEVEVDVRFAGFDGGDPQLPQFDLTVCIGAQVLMAMRLVEALVPKGRIGSAAPALRRRFLRERGYAGGVGLSITEAGVTRLSAQDVADSDWLPGTVAQAYGSDATLRGDDLLAQIAARDHVARLLRCHPSAVEISDDASCAHLAARPYELHALDVERSAGAVAVSSAAAPSRDFSRARRWWRQTLRTGPWPGEDLFFALAERFVGGFVLDDPAALAVARGRSCLFLANHQVGVESMLFNLLVAPWFDRPVVTVAKAEHKASWIGALSALCFDYPGIEPLETMVLIERDDPRRVAEGFARIAAQMQRGAAHVLVHVEGTRATACRQPVSRLSAALIDLALAAQASIVPVRFAGGLPVEPLQTRLEFPLGYGQQTIHIGRPLAPEALAPLPNKERVDRVLAAINGVGPALGDERPAAPDRAFAARVAARRADRSVSEEGAVLHEALRDLADKSLPIAALLEGGLPAGDRAVADWCQRLAAQLARRRETT